MQQVKNMRERLNSQGQWLQLGLFSASVLAPLVSRWNELRAMERARALREAAEVRLQNIRGAIPPNRRAARQQVEEIMQQMNETLPKRRAPSRTSTIIWVVGVSVGVVAAGVGTYLLIRRRMAADTEDAFITPLPFRRTEAPEDSYATARRGASNGDYAGTMATPFIERADSVSNEDAPATQQPAAAVIDAEKAAFVGNIRSLVYHLPDDDNLPQEDNRIYFASEEEAEAMGYHRAHPEAQEPPADKQSGEILASENSRHE